jgi:polyisoprenoid-binding protein YceI
MVKIKNTAFLMTLILPAMLIVEQHIPLTIQPSSAIVLKGTSTLHNFECKSTAIQGTIAMDSTMRSFSSIEVTIPVKTILSGNTSMDDNMYEALKEKENPDIKFALMHSDSTKKHNVILPDSTFQLHGTLSIAGKEQPVDLQVKIIKDENGIVTVRGDKKLLMTDYGVKPPTFMLGVLRTGNEVSVEFEVALKGTNSLVHVIQSN